MNPNNPGDNSISLVREKLQAADRIVILTGAGISAESGVPTFRGEGGWWRNYPAMELATPEAFARDPRLVWEFYNYRRELISKLSPNPAHISLAGLESRKEQVTILTQNIDGFHQAAGSRNILELHGNIWRVRCLRCGVRQENRTIPIPAPPSCNICGGMLRPDVVWFGENLEEAVLRTAWELLESCDLLLVIGTSGVVQPAASMVMHAKHHGAFTVEINLEPTPHSQTVDIQLLGKAGEILPLLAS